MAYKDSNGYFNHYASICAEKKVAISQLSGVKASNNQAVGPLIQICFKSRILMTSKAN